jgi:hypothetical protein
MIIPANSGDRSTAIGVNPAKEKPDSVTERIIIDITNSIEE